MKTKYMSRKFIVSIAGLLVAIFGIGYDNNIAVICGCFIAACFVIGEAIVDKAGAIHRTIDVTDWRNYNIEAPMREKDGNKNEA